MQRFQGAASIGIIGGTDGPTAIYLSGKDRWKAIARRAAGVFLLCVAVWRLAKQAERKKQK